MRHVAIYLRVSSKAQTTKSQRPDLERWAAAQDQPVVWYRDTFTGKSMDRPGWNKLQAAIDAGQVSAVVCWRLDRLGRTAKGLTALISQLREHKINLVSLKDGIDLSTTSGRLMANILASIAEFETEVRAERVLAGQARARDEGKTWGGGKPGRRVRVTTEKEQAVRSMAAAGKGATEISRVVGLSRQTIYTVISKSS